MPQSLIENDPPPPIFVLLLLDLLATRFVLLAPSRIWLYGKCQLRTDASVACGVLGAVLRGVASSSEPLRPLDRADHALRELTFDKYGRVVERLQMGPAVRREDVERAVLKEREHVETSEHTITGEQHTRSIQTTACRSKWLVPHALGTCIHA